MCNIYVILEKVVFDQNLVSFHFLFHLKEIKDNKYTFVKGNVTYYWMDYSVYLTELPGLALWLYERLHRGMHPRLWGVGRVCHAMQYPVEAELSARERR